MYTEEENNAVSLSDLYRSIGVCVQVNTPEGFANICTLRRYLANIVTEYAEC